MKEQIRRRGRDLATKVAPGVTNAVSEIGRLSRHLRNQRVRLDQLEKDMQEFRMLQRRIAELTDIVEELLLPISQRDNERVEAVLARYTDRL